MRELLRLVHHLRLAGLLASALVSVSPQAVARDAGGIHSISGVNQVGLGWLRPEERSRIAADMAANGVRVARLSLNEPFAASLDAAEEIASRGIQILLTISLNDASYYDPSSRKRPGPRLVDGYPLSQVDVGRFRQKFGEVWAELERRQIKLIAIQVGNEINWSFNGDLSVSSTGSGRVFRSAEQLPAGSAYLQGLDRYVSLVRAVDELRRSSAVNRGATIVATGLARIQGGYAAQLGADSVDPKLTLALLQQRGLFDHADVAAMHFYPAVQASPDQRRSALEAALSDCNSVGLRRSCWLTEWGISNTATSCPLDDSGRAALVREVRSNLDEAARQARLEAAFYFEWSGKTARSIWRCGGLTEAGQAAIRPLAGSDGPRPSGAPP